MFSMGKATRTSVAVNGIRTATTRVDKEAIYKDYRGELHHRGQEASKEEDKELLEGEFDSVMDNAPRFTKPTAASNRVSDRNIAGDSPGPDYYSTVASMHALDRGGVPGRQKGVRLTQAKRFAAYKREDGTIVEHPFDAIQTQKLLNRQPEVPHRGFNHTQHQSKTNSTLTKQAVRTHDRISA